MNNKLRGRMANGDRLIGTFVDIPHPAIVELIGHIGFDFVVIDTEHGAVSPYSPALEDLVRSAEVAGIPALVRVANNQSDMVLKALDAGAEGVIVPHVSSAEEARQAAQACRYPPLGIRGATPSIRASRYGTLAWETQWEQANRDVLCVALIENRDGMDNLQDIAAVPGIDSLFFGPFDLSVSSSGAPGEVSQETIIQRHLDEVVRVARSRNIPVCSLAWGPEAVKVATRAGCQLVAVSVDTTVLREAYQALLAEARNAIV